jgi:hypothetical protein
MDARLANPMNNVVYATGVAGLSVLAALAASSRAEPSSTPAAAPIAAISPMAEITDLYAWVVGANLNLVMDVSPADDGTRSFDPSVIYVFHLTSKPGLGVAVAGGTETQIVCKFASNTSVECWVTGPAGTKDYVAGDPTPLAGISSPRGKLRVFAGRRSDPRFFNQAGFAAAVSAIKAAPSTGHDAASCPSLGDTAAQVARSALAGGSDAFAAANVMALVVQVDRGLVNAGSETAVAVWGSTHAGS